MPAQSAVRQLDPLYSKSSKDFYGELVLDTTKSTEPKTEVLETLEEQSDLVIVDLSTLSLPSVLIILLLCSVSLNGDDVGCSMGRDPTIEEKVIFSMSPFSINLSL